MADSIEAFVKKLQEDGVEAGRQAGQQVLTEAEHRVKAIIDDANTRAEAIVEAARVESEKIRQRNETELTLAARDAVGRLQENLNCVFRILLRTPVEKALRDPEFLAPLIRDVVMSYVEADAGKRDSVAINTSEKTGAQLTQWGQQTLRDTLEANSSVQWRTALAEDGFELSTVDGTVEITIDSVVNVLLDMVGPELRKLIAATRKTPGESPPPPTADQPETTPGVQRND